MNYFAEIFSLKYPKKKVIITFGTFDLFHQGHYNILKRASKLGDILIVGVSSDWFNLTKKGVKTIDNQEKRMEKIKSLPFVDKVFLEESLEDKPLYIKKYKPDILVMGDDWKGSFDNLGVETVYFPRTPNISTTMLKINNIQYSNIILKKILKLHGTYKVPLTPTNEIFPLKKYKFYNYELWGPKNYDTMENYYSKKCPMMSHAYAKWEKGTPIFQITDFSPHYFNYNDDTDKDFNNDGIYCSKDSKSCIHTKNKYIKQFDKISIRQCCRNKLNQILIDVCQFLEKNKIPYFIYWGTLLGAIRHQGSIPWDTDNDIYILDKDFFRLLLALKDSEIQKKYFLTRVNSKFIRVNFSQKNRAHLDIYIAEQYN